MQKGLQAGLASILTAVGLFFASGVAGAQAYDPVDDVNAVGTTAATGIESIISTNLPKIAVVFVALLAWRIFRRIFSKA